MTSEMLEADKYLSIINRRGKERKPLKRVYSNMRKEGLFLKAYAKLYKNKGATTKGTDPTDSIQGMSRQRIQKIIGELSDGTYRCKPTRQVYIAKANGKQRPL